MHRKPPRRLPHVDYVGFQRYFLTFSTFRRRPHFTRHDIVDLTLGNFVDAAGACEIAITAYCFMPDHLHMLAEGATPTANGGRFISLARQKSGYAFSKTYGGRLWQRYGYEHLARDDESTFAIVKYILANPVRAGLVASPEDYPYSGSFEWSIREVLDSVGAWVPRKSGAG